MTKPHIADASNYLSLKQTLDTRSRYIKRAMHTLETKPPAKGGSSQDEIIVSRVAMLYVLERAMDGVDIATKLNETIYEHNMRLPSGSAEELPEVFDFEDDTDDDS